MNLTEKAAYIKGLIEGMGIKADTNEGKIYAAICDLLAEMALEVEDLSNSVEEIDENIGELDDAIGALDEDLDDLESVVYEDEDDEDDEEADDDLYKVTCPKCGDEVYLDEDTIMEGKIDCPNCGEPLEFDVCDCGCDHCGDDCDCDECSDEEDEETKK